MKILLAMNECIFFLVGMKIQLCCFSGKSIVFCVEICDYAVAGRFALVPSF